MKKDERDFLKKLLGHHKGLLAPVDLFNDLGSHTSEKIIHKLISEDYIEEVPTTLHEKNYTFYRASNKAHNAFRPFYARIWAALRGDVRTIVVSVITALVTTVATIYITKLFTR